MGKKEDSGSKSSQTLSSKENQPDENSDEIKKVADDLENEDIKNIALDFYTLIKGATRRWEMIIYPAMLGVFIMSGVFFAVLFVIISNIQGAVEESQIGTQMNQVAQNMAGLTDNIRIITLQMAKMQKSMQSIDDKMTDIKYMRVMSSEVAQMNKNMHFMNNNMGQMSSDFNNMNRNISKPLSMMNSFMPW